MTQVFEMGVHADGDRELYAGECGQGQERREHDKKFEHRVQRTRSVAWAHLDGKAHTKTQDDTAQVKHDDVLCRHQQNTADNIKRA